PGLIVARLHDDDFADHAGVARAAIFSAEQVIAPRCGRFEPDARVSTGHDVGLHAEGRYEDVVNHVLGRHDEFHRPAHWHVQLVDLSCAAEWLELPHPLLADDVHVFGVGWRRGHREEHAGAPKEDYERDEQRDDRPGDLERHPAVDLGADARRRTPPELHGV